MRLPGLVLATVASSLLVVPVRSWGQLGLTNYVYTFSYSTHVGTTDPGIGDKLGTVTPWLRKLPLSVDG
jgi:hypothetical protein